MPQAPRPLPTTSPGYWIVAQQINALSQIAVCTPVPGSGGTCPRLLRPRLRQLPLKRIRLRRQLQRTRQFPPRPKRLRRNPRRNPRRRTRQNRPRLLRRPCPQRPRSPLRCPRRRARLHLRTPTRPNLRRRPLPRSRMMQRRRPLPRSRTMRRTVRAAASSAGCGASSAR